MQDLKAEKLRKILEAVNSQEAPTRGEVTSAIKQVVDAFVSLRKHVDTSLNSVNTYSQSNMEQCMARIEHAQTLLDTLEKQYSDTNLEVQNLQKEVPESLKIAVDNLSTELRKELVQQIETVRKLIPSIPPAFDPTELQNQIDVLMAYEEKKLTPTEIRDALETLEGEDRLDASAIKNLPQMIGDKMRQTGFNVSLSSLLDVNLAGITAGQSMQWNGTQFKPYTFVLGVWSSTGIYQINDIVNHGGDLYKNITGSYTTDAPDIDTTNWTPYIINTASYTQTIKHVVRNSTGTTMPKGSVVYVVGANGTNILVALSDADTEVTSSKTLGLLEDSLAHNANGFVITEGLLSGIDTSAATNEGDSVWLSSTAGGFIFGAPPAKPAHSVYLGVVSRKNASNGAIFVKVQNGYELDELHNVSISSVTTGQQLQYGSDNLWHNAFTWEYLAFNWTTEPSLNSSITGGDVYNYTLNGVTRYRFVPTTYSPANDAFYSTLTSGALSGLITTRG